MNCLPPRTVGTTITESFRNTGWPPLRNILSKPSYINQGENGGSQIIKTSTLICNFFSYIFYCILFDFPLLILLLLADNPQSSSSSSSSSSSASSSTSASSGWFLPHPPLLLFLWKRGENVSCIFSSPFNISPTSFPPSPSSSGRGTISEEEEEEEEEEEKEEEESVSASTWNHLNHRPSDPLDGIRRSNPITAGWPDYEIGDGWPWLHPSGDRRQATPTETHRPLHPPFNFISKSIDWSDVELNFYHADSGGGREGASWGERRRERGLLFTFSSL